MISSLGWWLDSNMIDVSGFPVAARFNNAVCHCAAAPRVVLGCSVRRARNGLGHVVTVFGARLPWKAKAWLHQFAVAIRGRGNERVRRTFIFRLERGDWPRRTAAELKNVGCHEHECPCL